MVTVACSPPPPHRDHCWYFKLVVDGTASNSAATRCIDSSESLGRAGIYRERIIIIIDGPYRWILPGVLFFSRKSRVEIHFVINGLPSIECFTINPNSITYVPHPSLRTICLKPWPLPFLEPKDGEAGKGGAF